MNNFIWRSLILLFCLILTNSCSNSDDKIEDLQESQTALIEQQITQIVEACNSGKIIQAINSTTYTERGGWNIIFTDNTSIEITGDKSRSSITPLLEIDHTGFWTVSYDNNISFESLTDEEGNPISAIGEVEGHSFSVTATINEKGFHVFEVYDVNSGKTIHHIETSYPSSAQCVLRSIVLDRITGTVALTTGNGKSLNFHYAFERKYPERIVLLTDKIILRSNLSEEVRFRLEPADAYFIPQKEGAIELKAVKSTPANKEDGTNDLPLNTQLVKVEAVKDSAGLFKAIIQDKGISHDYKEQVFFVINTWDKKQNPKQISSAPLWTESRKAVKLPCVYIYTPDGRPIDSRDEWMQRANIKIVDEYDEVDVDIETEVKGRGNSTWWMPKRPYTFRMTKRKKVLGMPSHKRWILLANWKDRTLIRNAVAFNIAEKCMEWAPHGRFVELYINGEHQGNYYLCEKISIDKHRLDIGEIKPTDTEGENLTGGYVVEFDVYNTDEINSFYTQDLNLPVSIKSPNEEIITDHNSPMFHYIKNYINNVETLLTHERFNEAFKEIDVKSYIDWWLVHELTVNAEPNHPKSSYMYKPRNGKLKAGPVWDFDWGTFTPYKDLYTMSAIWNKYLFKSPYFREMVRKRWSELKPKFEEVPYFILEQADYIRESEEVNHAMWPIEGTHTNGDEQLTFDEAVNRLKDSYLLRIKVLDEKIRDL